jgi:DNA end-binding protein Ku
MRQSNWKGYLRLSLVAVPVRAYSANKQSEQFHLNQLHRTCHSRIRYQKTCPTHGEVTNDEIVSGYEYEKGQYVIVEKEELAQLRGERERSITIDAVVSPGTIDPLYVTDKSYYLFPDGKVGESPFSLLRQAMADEELDAVAHGVMFGREEMLLVRPVEEVLAITALKFAAEVARPADFGDVPKASGKKEELTLTKTLLKSFAGDDFAFESFTDRYVDELRSLIEAKVEGKEVIAAEHKPERPPTINLMDALKRSLAGKDKPERKAKAASAARPRRKSG